MIKILLTILVTKIYTLILKVAGRRDSQMLPVNKEEVTGISVLSVHGYTVTFYCECITYLLKYQRFKRTKVLKVYRLYAQCSEDTPMRLKLATEEDIYLPEFMPELLDLRFHRRMLLESYIDIVNKRMFDI
jgi:hypothetical protein